MRVLRTFIALITTCLILHPVQDAYSQTRRRSTNNTPSAKWVGQTGKDFVGKSTAPGPDQIQDIQVRVSGMFASRLSKVVLKGKGGGQWEWIRGENASEGWAIHVEAGPIAGYTDLYFETDQLETGREFELKWITDGQPEQTIYFAGGKADPTKAVASASLAAMWIGQNIDSPVDLTNRSAAVGPDGFEDAVIELSSLSDRDEISAIEISSENGKNRWSYGKNPDGVWCAELIRRPAKAKTASLVLSIPTSRDTSLEGQKLNIKLTYENGAASDTTIVAGKAAADLAMPQPELPKIVMTSAQVNWLGTVSRSKMAPGVVRMEVTGLRNASQLRAAVVTEPSGAVYSASEGLKITEHARPLLVDRLAQDKLRLEFLPTRDLQNVPLSIRLVYQDGSSQIIEGKGGATDLSQIVPEPRSGEITAKPGDDLQELVKRYGTVRLSEGEYRVSKTLTIDAPTQITADKNAKVFLKFDGRNSRDWTAAIKIRSGGVTLQGFAIVCENSIVWNQAVSYGPAVIATTDPMDNGFNHDQPLWGVNLQKLLIMGPGSDLSANSKSPPEALKLVRMMNVSLGRVEGCILKGGTVHVSGGPWAIRQNRHDGPLAGTFAYDAFAVMRPFDLIVEANRVEPLSNAGKLWRFLTLTHHGTNISVRGNLVRRTGPMKDDTIDNMNANEIFLTESYRIRFEGEPANISSDGSVVMLPSAMAEPPQPGDCVSILTGANAGKFHVVRQSLGNGSLWIEPPLDPKDRSINPPAISVSQGFKSMTVDRNTIDATGSDTAFNMVLAGNHFGTVITGNTLIGGGESLRLTAFPTEFPNIWGWSHVPMFGIVMRDNTISDAAKPGRLAVDQGEKIKTSQGRVYYSAELTDNVIEASLEGAGLQIGDPGTLDPKSLQLRISGNQGKSGDPEIHVISGSVNGRMLENTRIPISTGNSMRASDRRTIHR